MNTKNSLLPESLQSDDSMVIFLRLIVAAGQINMNFPPVTVGEITRRNKAFGKISRRYVKTYLKKAVTQGFLTKTSQYRQNQECTGYYLTDKGHNYILSSYSVVDEVFGEYANWHRNSFTGLCSIALDYMSENATSAFADIVSDTAVGKANLRLGYSPILYRDATRILKMFLQWINTPRFEYEALRHLYHWRFK